MGRALVDLDWRADTRPLHQTIESVRAENPDAIRSVADSWLICALAERDARAAESAVVALGENMFPNDAVLLDHDFCEGLIARMTNDQSKAHAAFSAARARQEKVMQGQADFGPAFCILGLIDAGLGRKEEALRAGRRAIELLPAAKDSINGAHMIEYFAITAAWVGDKDLASLRVLELSSYHAIVACVASGTGVAIVPKSVLATVQSSRVAIYLLPKVLSEVVTPLIWRLGESAPPVNALRELIGTVAARPRPRTVAICRRA